jgi:beta-glucosidase/6-phospho-beta-glucosidase/beta-galactosidase
MRRRLHGPKSYTLKTIFWGEVRKPGAYVSDLGAPIVPGFFLELLQTLNKRYHKPIIITENGIADRKDVHRPFYMLTHLFSVWKAIQQGVDIRGYLAWATVDNLEWLEGYKEEFGLLHVDPVNGKRTIRKSAHLYKDIINANGIHLEKLLSTYFDGEQRKKAEELIHHLFTHHGTVTVPV